MKWRFDWKPCPMCGHEIKAENAMETSQTDEFWLECPRCGLETKLFKGMQTLNEYWNKRNGGHK